MARSQSSAIVPWLLLGIIALIGYGSLYPFRFHFDATQPSLLEALQRLTWARAGQADRVRNVLLYIPFGFCLMLLIRHRFGALMAALVVTLLGMLFSLTIEVVQVYTSMRVPSLMDVTLNAAGSAVGAISGLVWRRLSALVYLPPNTRSQPGDRSALVVLLAWLAWRLAPFTPQVSLVRLKAALRPLLEFDFSLLLTLRYLLLWLVVAQAVMSYASRQRSNEVLLMLIVVVMVGRLLFVTPAFIPAELLALALLLPSLIVLHKLHGIPQSTLVLILYAGWFVYQRVWPLELGAYGGGMDLWPFLGWIKSGMHIDIAWLLGKLFHFSALIWLIKDAGLYMRNAVILVVATVFGIEVLQLWLPDRASSITDPALAALTGGLMLLISNERSTKRTSSLKHRKY